MRRIPVAFAAAVIVSLTGCATGPTVSGDAAGGREAYLLEARFGLRDHSNSYQGRLSWQHDPLGDVVLVKDPFGAGVAELSAEPGRARMTLASGEVTEAEDSADLMGRLTGVPLSVRTLARWLTGNEVDGAEVERDERGRLSQLVSGRWRLAYAYADLHPQALPSRVVASNAEGVVLRLAVDSWVLRPAP